MNGMNVKNLLIKATGLIGVASATVLLSLPGLAQSTNQPSGTPQNEDPASGGLNQNIQRQEGSDSAQPSGPSGTTQQNTTGGQSNQPGATTGGESNQQVQDSTTGTTTQQNSTGTTIRRNSTTQQRNSTIQQRNSTQQQTSPGTSTQTDINTQPGQSTTTDTQSTQGGTGSGAVPGLW